MAFLRSGVCHGTCLRTCRANPSATAVRRRMAVILEPTVVAAALITSRRYALSRFLLEARNRARAPLSAPGLLRPLRRGAAPGGTPAAYAPGAPGPTLSEALRPIGLRFPSTRLRASSAVCSVVPPPRCSSSRPEHVGGSTPVTAGHSMRSAIHLCGTPCSMAGSRGSVRTSLRPVFRPFNTAIITALRLDATRLSRHLLTHVPRQPLRSDLRSFHEHHILLRLQAGRHRLRPCRPAFRLPSVTLRADCDGLYATDADRPSPSWNSTWTRRAATATQDFVASRPVVAP